MMLFKRLACLLGLLGALGCGSDDAVSGPPEQLPLPEEPRIVETDGRAGGTLHYALAGEPSTFNMAAASESRAKLIAYLTTATLLEFDPLKQEVVEGLCKHWEISEDGRTVLLTLREGLRFSDGTPLDSRDVLFTFEKIYEEGSRNVLRDALTIEAKPLQVEALDSQRLHITLPKPYAPAEYILTTVPVFPRHKFQEPEKKIEQYWTLETAPTEMAGAGPFLIETHAPGERTVLRANPHYWKIDQKGNRLPYLAQLVFNYIEERNVQILRFGACQLDLLDYLLRPEDAVQLTTSDIHLYNAGASNRLTILWFNLNTHKNPETGNYYLAPDKREWFSNLEFRKAINLGISRDAIVRNVYLGHAHSAWTLMPASVEGWHLPGAIGYRHDLDRAHAMLREAGFRWQQNGTWERLIDPDGRTVRFEILTRADDVLGRIAAIVQQDLKELGVEVSIRQEEFRTVISQIMSRSYDAALLPIELPIEPADHLNVLLSSGPMHMWRPSQSQPATEWERRIDELMLRQITTLDLSERRRLYQEVQRILAEQVPLIPLVHSDLLIAVKNRVRNVRPTSLFPYGLWNAWELWIDDGSTDNRQLTADN